MAYEPEIFLSSESQELEKHRRAVAEKLKTYKYVVHAFEGERSRTIGERLEDSLVKYIDGSRVTVLLLGARYGDRQPTVGNVSWTEFEWRRASARGPQYHLAPFVHREHRLPGQDSCGKCDKDQREFIGRATTGVEYGSFPLDQVAGDKRTPEDATADAVTEAVVVHYRKLLDKAERALVETRLSQAAEKRMAAVTRLAVGAAMVLLLLLLTMVVAWTRTPADRPSQLETVVLIVLAVSVPAVFVLLGSLWFLLRYRKHETQNSAVPPGGGANEHY